MVTQLWWSWDQNYETITHLTNSHTHPPSKFSKRNFYTHRLHPPFTPLTPTVEKSETMGGGLRNPGNFYIFWSVGEGPKICSFVEFWSTFELQALLKKFLWVKIIHTRYLKGPPGSELHDGNKLLAIRLTNPFLLMKKLVPPLNAGFGNRFFM